MLGAFTGVLLLVWGLSGGCLVSVFSIEEKRRIGEELVKSLVI